MAKQKAKTQTSVAAKAATSRTGYKRKSNKRISPLIQGLMRISRKAFNEARFDKTKTFAQPEGK